MKYSIAFRNRVITVETFQVLQCVRLLESPSVPTPIYTRLTAPDRTTYNGM